jgi:hypothetical protein
LSLALMAHIPRNILKGNGRVAVDVDERASKQQERDVAGRVDREVRWSRGGPGELRWRDGRGAARITFTLNEGQRMLNVGSVVRETALVSSWLTAISEHYAEEFPTAFSRSFEESKTSPRRSRKSQPA